jgi:hypothetical protein
MAIPVATKAATRGSQCFDFIKILRWNLRDCS